MFNDVDSILVIDWPSREVPQQLALAGFQVVVRSGPGPEDYTAYEVVNGEVTTRRTGRAPERADLVYAYRPLSELPQIIEAAKNLKARILWTQSGFSAEGVKDPKGCWLPADELLAARTLVESAGLVYVSEPYIAEALAKRSYA